MKIFLNLKIFAVLVLFFVTDIYAGGDSQVQRLPDIVVTGAKTEVLLTNTTEKTEVIDSLEIAASGATSTEEILQRVPGFSLARHGGRMQARINGLPAEYTKILINGIPISGDMATVLTLQNIPASEIERIEIVRGASSTLYGTSAIGGVVNIITKGNVGGPILSLGLSQRYTTNIISQKYEEPGFADIIPSDGERNSWSGALNGSFNINHANRFFTSSLIAGYHHDPGVYDTVQQRPVALFDDRPFYTAPADRRQHARVSLGTSTFLDMQVTATYSYSIEERISSLTTIDRLTLTQERNEGSLKVSRLITDNIGLDWFGTYQHLNTTRERYDFNNQIVSEYSEASFPNFETELKSDIHIGQSQQVVVGISGLYEAIEAYYIIGERSSGTQVAAFVQNVINVRGENRYLITPGVRFNYNDRFSPVVVPKLSFRVNFFDELFARVAGGGGYRAPTLRDNYRDQWVHTGGTFVLSGNPDLRPETAWSINGSLGGAIGGEFSWEAYGHATYFFDRIATALVSNDTGRTARGEFFQSQRQMVNQDSAYTRGVDLSLNYSPITDLKLSVTYSYLQSRFWDSAGRHVQSTLFSPHTVKSTFSYEANFIRLFTPSLTASVMWQDEQLLTRVEGTFDDGEYMNDFFDINCAMSVDLAQFSTLTIGANNVLDNAIPEAGQGLGRTLYAQINFSFNDVTGSFNR